METIPTTATTADRTLTVRVPRSWVGRMTTSLVREAIRRYLANPVKLPQCHHSLDHGCRGGSLTKIFDELVSVANEAT